ncbi:cytochrome P450 [Tribonema minus]|uniref:Cytochrome P450 n=1 Tax=Tribonema minus TaxID=303371 RepID=A0A835YRL7_9STRA|nr:cytochrome P450 [Tribonema minus]
MISDVNKALVPYASGVAVAVLWLAFAIPMIKKRLTTGKLPPKTSVLLDLPLPIAGPILNLLVYFADIRKNDHKKRLGEVMRIPYVTSTAIVIVSPEGVKTGLTCRHDGKKVLSSHHVETIRAMWGPKALSNLAGSEHTRVKKLLHPAINAKTLAIYVSHLKEASKTWIEHVVDPNLGQPVKVYEPVRRFMMDTTLRLMLGLGKDAPKVANQVAQLLVQVWDSTFAPPFNIPGTNFHRGKRARAALLPIIRVLKKLKAKQESIKDPLDLAKCESMSYTLAFLKECLRVYSPVLNFPRTITTTFEASGYVLPKGYTYLYYPPAVQRHSVEDPDKIIPEKYDDPTCPLNRPYGFTPFAGGEYQCLGERFAEMEICILLRHLVRDFTWTHAAADPRIWYGDGAPLFMRFTDGLPLVFAKA